MEWIKRGNFKTIQEVVEANSGISIEQLLNPPKRTVVGIDKLADEFENIAKKGEKVFNCSDYDADGICSSLILSAVMEDMKIPYEVYIPRRMSDGYGINSKIVKKISNISVVICSDNGIAAHEVLNKLKVSGKKVFILDHHQAPADGILPKVDLVIDPEVTKDSEFLNYCGAGLCFKLAECLLERKKIRKKTFDIINVCAMIGTIADVMPLIDDNRRIVKDGLALLNANKCPLLTQECSLSKKTTSQDIAFKVAPMINACGRLKDNGGQIAYRILKEALFEKKNNLFYLISENDKRKMISEKFYLEALKLYELNGENMYPVILNIPECPEGIIGLIAGKITEFSNKPSIIFTESSKEGVFKGSARSIDGFNIKEFLDCNKELFLGYGGHKGAAGMLIGFENYLLLESIVSKSKCEVSKCSIQYDIECIEEEIPYLLKELDKFEPFGEGCNAPVFKVKLHRASYKAIGGDKKTVKISCKNVDAIGFGMIENFESIHAPIEFDAVGTISRNIYRDKEYVQFEMSDLKNVENKPKLNILLQQIAEIAKSNEIINKEE